MLLNIKKKMKAILLIEGEKRKYQKKSTLLIEEQSNCQEINQCKRNNLKGMRFNLQKNRICMKRLNRKKDMKFLIKKKKFKIEKKKK